MGLHLCVHVCLCVYKGVNLGKVGWEEGVRRRCGDKFISFHRLQKKTKIGHVHFFVHIACNDFFYVFIV